MRRVPGSRALALAARWFDAATVSRVFEPLIADYQREWLDATPARRPWISVRGMIAFARSVMSCSPEVLLAAPPASITRRVISRIIIVTSSVTVLMLIPILLDLRQLPPLTLATSALLLLPATIIVGFPFAMLSVADAIRRHTRTTQVERSMALQVGIGAVLVMVTVGGWVVPAANQQFREVAAPEHARPPAHGVRELTTLELFTNPARATADAMFTRGGNRAAVRRELNSRAALAVLPVVLLWLRWGALNRRRGNWYSPLPASLATVIAFATFFALYLASVWVEPNLSLKPGTGLWLPIALLVMWGIAERWCSRHQVPTVGTPHPGTNP